MLAKRHVHCQFDWSLCYSRIVTLFFSQDSGAQWKEYARERGVICLIELIVCKYRIDRVVFDPSRIGPDQFELDTYASSRPRISHTYAQCNVRVVIHPYMQSRSTSSLTHLAERNRFASCPLTHWSIPSNHSIHASNILSICKRRKHHHTSTRP